MKRKELIYNLAIVILVIAIVIVIYFKFIANNPPLLVQFNEIDQINIVDASGAKIKLTKILNKEEEAYCLIFFISDCYSCIYKGLQDLIQLKKDGHYCFGLVIHDIVGEVEGWAGQHEFSPFYMLRKSDFYKHVDSPLTPVLVKLKHGRVKSFRFIKP